ncbi:MAG: alpha/beta fold hydrolase [Rhizobiaceae bacterium]|nr:alpha/beta fold hydrolase [Rhizobiaceae bacterium]
MRYRFAGFELDDTRHTLSQSGQLVPVEPLVFDLLRLLAQNAGNLVTRDHMIEEIWKGRIVSESAISACISAARRSVGDDGKHQAVIRTVPRRGLVLVAAMESVDQKSGSNTSATANEIQRIRYVRNKDGRRLAYALTGNGPPVLYMRLSGAANLEVEWGLSAGQAYFNKIGGQFTVLRCDPIGAGLSDNDVVETDFSRMAADVITVADAAGIDRFAVFSTSGGVLPAVHLAAQFPNRVTRLAIVGGYVDGRMRRQNTNQTDVIKELISQGWDEPEGAFATAVLASYFPEGPFDVVKELVRLMQSSMTPDNILKIRDAINSVSIAHLLGNIVCPTLIVHGRRDGVHPISEAQKLASEIPSSELVILDTSNHLPLPGSPVWEPFMDTLIEFLNEN